MDDLYFMKVIYYVCSSYITYVTGKEYIPKFLNQARSGLRPARAWFLNITSVRIYACVCVSAPEAMNN